MNRIYRHYGHSVIAILMVMALSMVAFDCGHLPQPKFQTVVRRAGW